MAGKVRKKSGIGMVRTPVSGQEYEDGYTAKLVKYIPAEVLVAFIPLVALADKISPSKELWLWVTVTIGAVCVVGYSRWQATDVLLGKIDTAHGEQANEQERWSQAERRREYERLKPYPYFYVLAVVAFGGWALGTAAPVRHLIGMDATQGEFVVAAVTLMLPLADATLRHFSDWLAEREMHPLRAVLHR